MKICSKCKIEKTLDEFYKRKDGSLDGRMSSCKVCKNKSTYQWREKQEKGWANKYQKSYQQQKDEGLYCVSKEARSFYKRATRYSVTKNELLHQLKVQNNLCAICQCDIKDNYCVDHDHEAHYVRGLLCSNCNTGLGMFGDSVTNLGRAAHYLENSFLRCIDG